MYIFVSFSSGSIVHHSLYFYVCTPLCKINYRRQVDSVGPDDIILTDITDNEQGQLTFTMHIQVNNGTGVLSASTLQESIEVGTNGY